MAKTDSAYYSSTRPGPPRLRRRIGYWIIGPLAAAVLAIYAAGSLPASISLAEGHGTHGTFTAGRYTTAHHGQRSWTGTFTPQGNGPVVKDVPYNGGLPDATVRGTKVSAVYAGGQAYAPGSKQWVLDLVLFAAGVLVFLVWCWRVPVAYLRRSGSVPPPPWVRTA